MTMLTIRKITPKDDAAVASVIRTVMPEFGCVGEGYSINDPEVAGMHAAYSDKGAAFFVLEQPADEITSGLPTNRSPETGKVVVGCGGYAPLAGGEATTCELRKMYLLPAARGKGGGRLLLDACLTGARADGYERMYLESVAAMKTAHKVYERYGFIYLDGPRGDTGHSLCDVHMLRDLQ